MADYMKEKSSNIEETLSIPFTSLSTDSSYATSLLILARWGLQGLSRESNYAC
jgi:hypothetical protein